jgi:hypothetical protein
MKTRWIPVYAAAALAAVLGGLAVYNSTLSIGAGQQVTFLSLSIQSPYAAKVVKSLLVPGASLEEPEWLAKAQSDPDPKIRLNAVRPGHETPRRVSTL